MPNTIIIHINHTKYDAPKTPMTGAELRALPSPAIGPEHDLYLVVPGPGDDNRIDAAEAVELKNGMHFYTAPTTINPGTK